MRLRAFVAVFISLAVSASFAQAVSPETKQAVLAAVAKKMKDDAYVGGVDFSKWEEYVKKYQEFIDKAETADEFVAAVNRAFDEFGVSHVRLMTPRSFDTQRTGKSVGIGILADPRPDGVRVAKVLAGGPADKAGVKENDLILKANGEPVKGPEQIRGEKGTQVELEIKRPDGTMYTVTITRDEFSLVVKDEIKWLDDKTALITINSFNVGYDRKLVDSFFEEVKKAERLVIDLRSNGGGSTLNLFHLAGKIMEPGTAMGKFITRGNANAYLKKHPGEKPDPVKVATEFGITLSAIGTKGASFKGQVVVLTSPMSASASEIFAAAVQDNKRGKVVGTKTAGAVLASTFAILPERYAMQIPVMEYVSLGGVRLEGAGVKPDIEVEEKIVGNDEVVIKVAIQAFSQEAFC